MRKAIYAWAVLALFGVSAAVIAGLVLWSHGLGSRPQPSELEASVAMKTYDSAVPKRYDHMQNPPCSRGH